MVDPAILIDTYERNYRIIRQQADGLTHADSLLQMPSGGNCLNWVIGHIISARSSPMKMLGIAPVWTDEQRAPYRMGSAPITPENSASAVRLEALLDALDRSQTALIAALRMVTTEALSQPSGMADRSVGASVNYFGWHEGFHVGQLEYLRNLAGKHEQVI